MYPDKLSRRFFLQSTGAALVVAIALPPAFGEEPPPPDLSKLPYDPAAFIRIAPDNTVTVVVKHIEFGQGPNTGVATIIADELDADWSQMRAESAPANDKLYANPGFGAMGTGGSSAMKTCYLQMRKAGAAAREMLVTAAAKKWSVKADTITVDKGVVMHAASGRKATFGELATAASKLKVPAEPKLKSPSEFKLIGKEGVRIDAAAKSDGTAKFTYDLKRPGMVHSAILHAPAFRATPVSVDDAAAKAMPGVLAVLKVPQGVAVIAQTRWQALKALPKLKVTWDNAKAETRSTDEMYRTYAEAAKTPGKEAEKRGDVAAGMAGAAKTIDAEYRFPYLAHAPMEPMNAVIDAKRDSAEIWLGSQMPTGDQKAVAGVLGLKQEQVKVNTMLAGGSFGRLVTPDSAFSIEVATVAKAWGKGPVKHAWTRENDIRGGYYRPLSVQRIRGGVDAAGNIVGWDHVIAIQSFVAGTPFEPMMIQNGIDNGAIEGATQLPYQFSNLRVGQHLMENKVPTLWWRSVGHTHTAYVTQTFLDQLLELGGKDAVQGRLALLKADDQRYHGVLKHAAEMAGWSGAKAGDGKARGVALHKSFDSYVAQIVEVSRDRDGMPKVDKVWVAIDCGTVINPDVVRAQMEGCIGFGLGAALYSEVNIEPGGAVVEGNFNHYPSLRMREMPQVEVGIVKSDLPPSGVGEPGLPPLAPAMANAWRVLTGEPVRVLPFSRSIKA